MHQRGAALLGLMLLMALCLAASPGAAAKTAYKRLPVAGMVTLLELGAPWCGPCQRMAPVLAQVEQEYRGRAAVVSLNVDDYPRISSRLGVRTIPTLIFFDQKGRVVYRHMGFLAKEYIELIFEKLGVAKPSPR